ncbi:MAG: hypothetical protein V3T23_13810 [Nitrososphaerales archaeon]
MPPPLTYVTDIVGIDVPVGEGGGDIYPILNNDLGIVGLTITSAEFRFDIEDSGIVGVDPTGKFALVDLDFNEIPDVTTRETDLSLFKVGFIGIKE